MQLSAVQAFVVVCDSGSFRAAAQRLHLTQPAISKRIAAVESRLGYRLFDRVGRRVGLTEAGESFLPHARRLLAELDDAQRRLDALSDHVGGHLALALSHHVALHRMPPLLRRFVACYPDVELQLQFLGSEDACHAVLRGDIDVAIITLPQPPMPELVQREVWPDPLRILVAADHPLAGAAATPAMLADFPTLLPQPETTTYAIVAEALAAHAVTPRVNLASNYLETLRMLAAVGMGWTALPESMAGDDLVALDLPDLTLHRSLGSVRHPGRSLSNAARALLGLLHG